MTAEECEHGERLDMPCPPCDGPPTRRPAVTVDTPVVEAQYDGQCPSCDEEIVPGDRIIRLEESELWVHEWCAP